MLSMQTPTNSKSTVAAKSQVSTEKPPTMKEVFRQVCSLISAGAASTGVSGQAGSPCRFDAALTY
jgi:hypothetical protein